MSTTELTSVIKDLLQALNNIAPEDGPDLARSESGGYECPHCGGFWYDHKGDFKHERDCSWVDARAAIKRAEEYMRSINFLTLNQGD